MSDDSSDNEDVPAPPPGILMIRSSSGVLQRSNSSTDVKNNTIVGDTGNGDIGNPPPPHFLTVAGNDEEEEEDDDFPPTFKNIHPLNTNTEGIEMETIRKNYSVDTEEEVPPLTDDSPSLPKRTSVFTGHEHEDKDDFMISTMLAIRTAV